MLMLRPCALCLTRPAPSLAVSPCSYLCLACYASCRPSHHTYASGVAAYAYRGPLRELILRTKIRDDQYALRCLCELLLCAPNCQQEANACQQIVAAPSSLWGRLRGRIDLAWFLASAVATTYERPLLEAPQQLYWRLKKRAHSVKNPGCSLQFPSVKANIPTLIIDDLMTTGTTLAQVAASLPGSNCRFLTLGDATSGAPHD